MEYIDLSLNKIILLIAFILPGILTACNTGAGDFVFLDANSRTVSFKKIPALSKSEGSHILLIDEEYKTPVYSLKKEIFNINNQLSLNVEYKSSETVFLYLYYDNKTVYETELPRTDDYMQYLLNLEDVRVFDSFQFKSNDPGNFNINYCSMENWEPGVFFGDTFKISEGMKYTTTHNSPLTHEMYFEPLVQKYKYTNENFVLSISYEADFDIKLSSPDIVNIDFGNDDVTFKYYLRLKNGEEKFHFYRSMVNFVPEWIKFKIPEGVSITINSFRIEQIPEGVPLFADFKEILDINPEYWRNKNYELYSWDLFPDVLVFDFLNYDIQSNYFKRLAFFVEKYGYVGTILSNDDLSGKHGWNAHDYRPEDLAAFFNKTSKEGVELNDEEYHLLEILLNNKILAKDDEQFLPGEGAIISISQESYRGTRKKLLNHEGSHGIVFVLPEYFDEIQKIWDEFSADEKKYWKVYLDFNSYNTNDEYLLVNEFQAYVVQRKMETVDWSFNGYAGPRLMRKLGKNADFVQKLIDSSPNVFIRMSVNVDKVLYSFTQRRIGDLYSLKNR